MIILLHPMIISRGMNYFLHNIRIFARTNQSVMVNLSININVTFHHTQCMKKALNITAKAAWTIYINIFNYYRIITYWSSANMLPQTASMKFSAKILCQHYHTFDIICIYCKYAVIYTNCCLRLSSHGS